MARAKNCSGKKKKSLLPKWDLSDLYKGTDSLVLKSDLKRARKATLTFRKKYFGSITKLLEIPNVLLLIHGGKQKLGLI